MSARSTERPVPAKSFFMAGALLIPLLFFVLLEVGLRLADYGDGLPLFVEVPGYPDYLQPNPDVGRRFFRHSSLVPSPAGGTFARNKSSKTFRIFVQGGSTAAGFPYGHGAGFPRILRRRLVQAFPDLRIEVVNTAMDAVSSFTIGDFAGEIVNQNPDAVLVYAGHNEYYGALGVGSTESLGEARWVVRAYLALDHFRMVQLLEDLLSKVMKPSGSSGAPADGATLMQEMARDREIALGSPRYRRGLEQFRANMTATLCRYRDAGIPVFVGTVLSNERDQPPFVSGLGPSTDGAKWAQVYDDAVQKVGQGDPESARSAVEVLLSLDGESALAQYLSGRLLLREGRASEALGAFRRAKDLDLLRFRAPEEMNDVLRDAAAQCGATVVETRDRLAASASDGIIGHELILEHLHPNVDGYFLMADAFYEALAEGSLLEDWPDPLPIEDERQEVLVTALDSALASLHVRRLKNSWPFQPLGVTRQDTFSVRTLADSLALDVLQRRRSWLDATAQLGARYEAEGQLQEALRAALALVSEEPHRAVPYVLSAKLLLKMGRFEDASRMFALADEREPSIEARRGIGRILLRLGRGAEAVAPLRAALVLDPADGASRLDLATAYAMSGQLDEARAVAEALRRDDPGNEGAARLIERLDARR